MVSVGFLLLFMLLRAESVNVGIHFHVLSLRLKNEYSTALSFRDMRTPRFLKVHVTI